MVNHGERGAPPAGAYRPSPAMSVLASVSGGKDSSAMMLFLREREIPFRAVFFDTGWEHPATYQHVSYLEQAIGVPIERHAHHVELADELVADAEAVEALLDGRPSAFVRLCLSKGIFPRRTVRFCTQLLKVKVASRIVGAMHEAGESPVNAIGVRASESAARAALPELEIAPALDCLVWRPLLRWSTHDVVEIHRRHNIALNPLYARGAGRVGCWPCIMAGKSELRLVGRDEPRMEAIRLLEAAVRRDHARRASGRGEPVLRPPTLFTAARRDPDGERPGVLIDEAVRWARTSRGASLAQETLFDDPSPNECLRWGLCEVEP